MCRRVCSCLSIRGAAEMSIALFEKDAAETRQRLRAVMSERVIEQRAVRKRAQSVDALPHGSAILVAQGARSSSRRAGGSGRRHRRWSKSVRVDADKDDGAIVCVCRCRYRSRSVSNCTSARWARVVFRSLLQHSAQQCRARRVHAQQQWRRRRRWRDIAVGVASRCGIATQVEQVAAADCLVVVDNDDNDCDDDDVCAARFAAARLSGTATAEAECERRRSALLRLVCAASCLDVCCQWCVCASS